jgi:hypothetical protein
MKNGVGLGQESSIFGFVPEITFIVWFPENRESGVGEQAYADTIRPSRTGVVIIFITPYEMV